MKTKKEIQQQLETITETIKQLYNELDITTDKEKYKSLFEEVIIHSGKESLLK